MSTTTKLIVRKLVESGSPRLMATLIAVRLDEMSMPGVGLSTLAAGDDAMMFRWRRFLQKPTKLLSTEDARELARALDVPVAVVEIAALVDLARHVGYTSVEQLLA